MRKLLVLPFLLLSLVSNGQNFEWANLVGGSGIDANFTIDTDKSGNVIYVGTCEPGTIDLDPGLGQFLVSNTGISIYIIKLDPTGQFIWGKVIDRVDWGNGQLTIDSTNNIYFVGAFDETVDFDPGPGIYNLSNPPNNNSIFLLKLDSTGNFVWAKSYLSNGTAFPMGIDIDSAQNIYFNGTYSGNIQIINFNDTILHECINNRDAIIVKVKNTGETIWSKSIHSSLNCTMNDLKLSIDNKLLMCGNFYGQADFDPDDIGTHLLTANSSDGYILKLDTAGIFMNVYSLTGASSVTISEICTNDSGEFAITGSYNGLLDLNPGPGAVNTNSISDDFFLSKYDSIGNLLWYRVIPTDPNMSIDGYSVTFDRNNNLYVSGHFSSNNPIDIDPGADTLYWDQINGHGFIQKYDSSGNLILSNQLSALIFDFHVDDSNSVYFVGRIVDDTDFDFSNSSFILSPILSQEGFTCKLSQCMPFVFNIKESRKEVCYGDSIVLNIIGDLNGNGYWSLYEDSNQGTLLDTSALFFFTFEPQNSGYYYVSGSGGCNSYQNYDSVYLTINIIDTSITLNGIVLSSNHDNGIYQWLDCITGLPVGTTTQSYTPTTNGIYSLVINDGNCSDTSSCITINTIGIKENQISGLSIYPNPAKDILTIEQNSNSKLTIEIINIEGRLIQSFTSSEKNIQTDVSEFANGMYFINVKSETGNAVYKLVKE